MRSKVLSQQYLNLTSRARSLLYYITIVPTEKYMFLYFRYTLHEDSTRPHFERIRTSLEFVCTWHSN